MSKNIIQTQYWLELAYKATQEENEQALNTLLNKINIIIDNISVLKDINSTRIIDFAIGANLFSRKEWNSFINHQQAPEDKDVNYYLALIPNGIVVQPQSTVEGWVFINDLQTYVSLYEDDELQQTNIGIGSITVGGQLVDSDFQESIESALIELGVEWWQEAINPSDGE